MRHEGWRIGIITNGATRMQRRKIALAGLGPLIDGAVISGEVGLAKPDPRIFALARDLLGGGADAEGWMVGDLLHTDIAGGSAAGLQTVWLSPPGRRSGPPAPLPAGATAPDHVVETIGEAFSLLLRPGA